MERKFSFYRYAEFDVLEEQAKNAKIGIWGDPDLMQDMNALSLEERELLTLEQEKEYLALQEELLAECMEAATE